MPDETISFKFANKICGTLKFFYGKNIFLAPQLCFFSYLLTIVPSLVLISCQNIKKENKNYAKQMHTVFCLRLDKTHHISLTEFKSINLLVTKERIHKCMNAITFKFVNNSGPFYLNKICEFTLHCSTARKNSFPILKYPLGKTNTGQKTLSCIGPSLWSNLPEPIKKRIIKTLSNMWEILSKPWNIISLSL